MINRTYRNMLQEYVKKCNKLLDLKPFEQINLVFNEVSNSCYHCEIKQYGKTIVEGIREVDSVLCYIYGVAVALNELGVFKVWAEMIKFDHIIDKRL